MPKVLQIRKLWAAIVGLVFIIVNALLNQQQIDPDTVTNAIMGIVAAYMATTAYEDAAKAKSEGQTTVTTPADNVTVVTEGKPTVGPTGLY